MYMYVCIYICIYRPRCTLMVTLCRGLKIICVYQKSFGLSSGNVKWQSRRRRYPNIQTLFLHHLAKPSRNVKHLKFGLNLSSQRRRSHHVQTGMDAKASGPEVMPSMVFGVDSLFFNGRQGNPWKKSIERKILLK